MPNQNKKTYKPASSSLLALALLGASLFLAATPLAAAQYDEVERPNCIGAGIGENCYGAALPADKPLGSEGTCVGFYRDGHCTGVQV